jgi:hypothetical protein
MVDLRVEAEQIPDDLKKNQEKLRNDYSAINATELLEHPHYEEFKRKLKDTGIWKKAGLSKLESNAKSISLAK